LGFFIVIETEYVFPVSIVAGTDCETKFAYIAGWQLTQERFGTDCETKFAYIANPVAGKHINPQIKDAIAINFFILFLFYFIF